MDPTDSENPHGWELLNGEGFLHKREKQRRQDSLATSSDANQPTNPEESRHLKGNGSQLPNTVSALTLSYSTASYAFSLLVLGLPTLAFCFAIMPRGRRSTTASAFVCSEMLHGSSSSNNTLSTQTGCTIGGSSMGLGCLRHLTMLRNRISVVGEEAVDESIMTLLMDILKVNPYAQLLKRINQYPSITNLRLHICKDVSVDHRRYNSPSADQVAAIWVEGNDNANIPYDRDIVVHASDGHMHILKHYFGCYDPLQYPLFFPYGDVGWQQHILKSGIDQSPAAVAINLASTSGFLSFPQDVSSETRVIRGKNDRMVSCREYYCYRIQIRDNDTSVLLYGGRLLQQFIVNMYIKLEITRLDYYRRNQTEIRSEMYQGIVDSVVGGETRASEIGHRIVLPTSFIGGPRDMRKRYLDAIALVKDFGKPDLFLTITCNPEWKEIKDNLFDGQVTHDRPDLVSRVFRSKLVDLKDQILKKCIFGRVVAFVYVIEFQKRGLPHCHMLLILSADYKISSPEMFDSYVAAEIPDENNFPKLFRLVSMHMMHGPCGVLDRKCPCMINGQCKSHYPRAFSEQSMQGRDGYPIYRRRNDGRIVEVRHRTLNSQWVVPYNPFLLYRYDCHINVEICSGLTAVKYLYKYIYKGHDKIYVNISPHDFGTYIDEIKAYRDARWVSAPEAMWRIYEFDLNEISPPVINLPLHLPNKQCVTFWNNQDLQTVLDSEKIGKTMLTEYFETCCRDVEARKFLYSEFPQHYVWDRRTYHLQIIIFLANYSNKMDKVELTPLKELKPDNKAIVVKVLILRQGSEVTTKQGKTIRKMILADEEGTLIHGLIFSNVIKQFQGIMETDKAYMIYNPFVKVINSNYENVHSSFELLLKRGTVVTELAEKLAIPQLNLPFKRFSQITPQLSDKENQHIIGVLKKVMQLIVFTRPEGIIGYKRDIVLLDTTLTSININLWDDLALNEGQMMKRMESNYPIISLTNLRMQEYNRVYQLKSRQTTSVFFNPPCTQTDVANSWLDTEERRKKLNTIWMRKMFVDAQCVTIDEVVKKATTLTEHAYYYFKGTIKEIENGSLPYYEACDHCLKAATKMSSDLTCLNCLKLQVKIAPRYRLSFLLDDGTNIARITIFEEVVEAIIGYHIEDYMKIHNQLAPDTTINNPIDALLNDNYKVLFKLDHSVDKHGTLCSIQAEGVDKIDDNLNIEKKIKKRRLTKKSKVETEDTKGNKKLTEIDDDETLGDYTKK